MRYRDDTFELSINGLEVEREKTEWMNNNVDERIRVTDNLKEGVKEKTSFLDIAVQVMKDRERENKLITSTYSKPTDTHQYLSPKSCHPKQQTKHIPYGVINRIRRKASHRLTEFRKTGFSRSKLWNTKHIYLNQDIKTRRLMNSS